jgi:hypothetical protein
MSGLVLFVVFIVLTVGLGIVWPKRKLARALQPESVTVPLSAERAVEEGVKASGSLLHRMAKTGGKLESMTTQPKPQPLAGGGYSWPVQVKGGTVVFEARPSGKGVEVVGWAEQYLIAEIRVNGAGFFALGIAMGNAINRALGIPKDAGSLLRRRRRVLRAIAEAAPAGERAAAA